MVWFKGEFDSVPSNPSLKGFFTKKEEAFSSKKHFFFSPTEKNLEIKHRVFTRNHAPRT